jgi:phenylalanine-4-hydroxylase
MPESDPEQSAKRRELPSGDAHYHSMSTNPSPDPNGPASDYVIDQGWSSYSADEHRLWSLLYERQHDLLAGRACQEFMNGLEALNLNEGGIPDFAKINPRLERLTGWRVVAVPGLVPDAVFFECLANRVFPSARFLRSPEELDYLSEPDIFHDVFGHVPMLTDPTFANYMQAYGAGGLRALGLNHLHHLARLYWYTVEFGLLSTSSGLRIYGAGIVSSRAETLFALENASPNRITFDMTRVMRTLYRIDDFQQTYFVIPSIADLLEATMQDFTGIYTALDGAADIGPGATLPSDGILTLGSQARVAA